MSIQTLNLTQEVYQYYQAHAYREPAVLAELRLETEKEFASANMQISPEQGQFMQLLVKLAQAKKILEIGTFAGYSALWMALGLPEDGRIITCDRDPKSTALAKQFWQRAGVEEKVELKLAPALETLQALETQGEKSHVDFVFIDADKKQYNAYYEYSLRLLKPGGLIVIDNTLQRGAVADSGNKDPNTLALRTLNDKLRQDPRVMIVMLPLSDGVTLAYKQERGA